MNWITTCDNVGYMNSTFLYRFVNNFTKNLSTPLQSPDIVFFGCPKGKIANFKILNRGSQRIITRKFFAWEKLCLG